MNKKKNKNINKKEGLYIANIDGMWIRKGMLEKGEYVVSKEHLDKALTGKLDYCYELECSKLLDLIDIDKIGYKQYTLDIVNVKFERTLNLNDYKENTDEIRKELYENGFKMNGNKYVEYKRSSGKARVGQTLFIRADYYDEMIKWSRMGLDLDGTVVDIAGVRAYESLSLSSIVGTINISADEILVIDDYDSKFNANMSVTELINGNLITKNKDIEESNSIWDGQGLLDSSVFEDNDIIKGKGMALLRNRMMKCCAFNCNIQDFFDDNGISKVVDIFGEEMDASKIKLITTPNSLKIKKFADYIPNETNWLDYWKSNCGNVFGVCKSEKVSHVKNYNCELDGSMNRLSYQMVNTIPFTEEKIELLLANEKAHIEKLKNDIDYFLDYTNNEKVEIENFEEMEIEKEYDLDINNCFNKLIHYNKKIEHTKVFRDYKDNFIKSEVNKLRAGKVRVYADYCTVCSNPIEMLFASIGKFNEESVALKNNEVFTNRAIADGKEVVLFRNPHINSGNIYVAKNVDNDDIAKYMNVTANIIIINSIDNPILTTLQGMDMDSDTVLVVDDDRIIEPCKRINSKLFTTPCNKVAGANKKRELNNSNKCSVDIITSKNYIGVVVNLSQVCNSLINDLLSEEIVDYELVRELYNYSSRLSSISCVEIDKAKKMFEDLDINKELNIIKARLKKISSDKKIIKPDFFRFVGDTECKKNRAKTRKAKLNKLNDDTIEMYLSNNNVKYKDVFNKKRNIKDKVKHSKLVEELKNSETIVDDEISSNYAKFNTPMDVLNSELDNIKSKTKAKNNTKIEVIEVVKNPKKKADEELVTSVITAITDADKNIRAARLNDDLDNKECYEKVKEIKKEVVEKLPEKITKADLFGIMKEGLNKVNIKNGKKKVTKSGIESLVLELLFSKYGDKMISMFEREE